MAAQDTEAYKKKLRQRSASTPAIPSLLKVNGEIPTLKEQLENLQEQDRNSSAGNSPKSAKQIEEIPIVQMSEFETINMESKLNVLMAAINTMNTNFHMKFESLEKKLSAEGGIQSKIVDLEGDYQILCARVDNAEGALAAVTENTTKLNNLEQKIEDLCDALQCLRGLCKFKMQL